MTAQTSEHEAVVKVLLGHRDIAVGGHDPRRIADEWLTYGFGAIEVAQWLAAKVFDAGAAHGLRQAGVVPDQAAAPCKAVGFPEPSADLTVGWVVASGEITIKEAVSLLQRLQR